MKRTENSCPWTFGIFCAAFFCFSALGAILPPDFYESLVVDGISGPTTLTFAPDGRLFVCQQDGKLRVVKDGKLLQEPALSVETDTLGEHGLLGVAFDPNFETNHFLYVYYTARKPQMHNRLSRFVLDGDVAGPESVLFELDDVGHSIFHNGAILAFGPDGKLYLGPGENGGTPFLDNAQRLTNLFGKILRLNADGSIPSDNPFYSTATGNERAIFAYGLRNPYSLDFEPGTGRLFVNDIGGKKFEEINVVEGGKNYGWPLAEGESDRVDVINPLFTYAHGPVTSLTEGCAVTGGAFYHPKQRTFPEQFSDKYFFVDYCSNWIRVLDPKTGQVSPFGSKIAANPTVLRVGPDGSLYYASRWMEGVYQIAYSGPKETK